MEVRRLMKSVPQAREDLDNISAAALRNPIYLNLLITPDGSAASIVADFHIDKAQPLYTPIFEALRAVVDPERDGTVNIHIGGAPVQLAGFEHYMAKMPLYFGIAFAIIMVIQYVSFRSLQGMLLPVLTALLSVVWALGAMGLMNVHMDVLNTTTPILVMAVAAGHAIQMLKRYYEEYERLRKRREAGVADEALSRRAIVESVMRVGPIMIITGLIAAITFFTLTTSDISVVRHFGVLAGTGVIAAIILEMSFIPALRALLRPPKALGTHALSPLDRVLIVLSRNLVAGRAPVILISMVAVIVLAAAGAMRLEVNNSLKRYHNAGTEIRKDDDELNRRFGGANSVIFLVEGPRQDSLKEPRTLEAVAKLQAFLESQPHVGKTQSIADLVKRMNQAMHGDDPAYYRIPEDRLLIAQYLLLYSLSGDPEDFNNFVDGDYQKAAIWVFLKEDGTAYVERLHRAAREVISAQFPPDVRVRLGGPLARLTAINESLTLGKFKNMAQIVFVVYLLSCLALRSWIAGLFVVTPLLAIILANFGMMGWLGIPLDMGTATTAAMAIGVGADYELYILFRFREEFARNRNMLTATRDSLLTSGKAVLFVALSVAGGYSVLLFSGFGFYTRLAIMVTTTMLISAASALIFLRSTMMIFKPRFVFGDAPTQPSTSTVGT
jgi:predicted RND superfamily exporter protein